MIVGTTQFHSIGTSIMITPSQPPELKTPNRQTIYYSKEPEATRCQNVLGITKAREISRHRVLRVP